MKKAGNATIDILENKTATGRPCKYESHVKPRLAEIEKWVEEGLTDYCIAENLHIHPETLGKYKKEYPDLIGTYKKAQAKQVSKVVNALFQRATGYKYEEVTKEDGKPVKTVEKHIPGDTTAQQVYLYNRAPEAWRSKNHTESISFTQNIVNIDQRKVNLEQLLSEYEKRKSLDTSEFQQIED